jgi:fructosamine-3-kinase
MGIPVPVGVWLENHGWGSVTGVRPVGGGCINNGARISTASGRTLFLKTNPDSPADMFEREAEGLQALNVSDGLRLPQVFLAGPDFLLLEDLNPAPRRADYWEAFGRGLAHVHHHTAAQFGFTHDNYIGSTPQPNPWTADGYAFFAESRLLFQARLAQRRGLLEHADLQRAERLARRLSELIPPQPASLIHGDLWSGNAIADATGGPALIDPAAHYGWAEAELGMTALFGGFPDSFYRAYEEARPLSPGWRKRLDIYNLYHILNHLNLFGEGYLGQVVGILRHIAG